MGTLWGHCGVKGTSWGHRGLKGTPWGYHGDMGALWGRGTWGPISAPQRRSRRFYPTRLAIALASGTSGTPPEPDTRGFIVVETNYRIYAYTGGWHGRGSPLGPRV